jgi:ABC-type sugar transport systems, permease components
VNRETAAGPLPEPGIRGHQAAAGWLFLTPVIVILGLFLIVPIFMAAWVSVSDWTGNGSPFGSNVHFVGLDNYRQLLTTPGLDQSNFGTALRNNFYYVLLVVPIQTAVSLFLAVLVTRALKFIGFFRTAFYFPSVTSSVAITVVFLFLFNPQGAINKLLSYVGVTGPRGSTTRAVSSTSSSASSACTSRRRRSRTGCSSASATGTGWRAEHRDVRVHHHGHLHHLGHLHAHLPRRAAGHRRLGLRSGGARRRDRVDEVPVRHVPMIRPAIFTVVTLGLIGTWQVFDQIYTGTKGSPSNTTLTPAFLSFNTSFNSNEWGVGAAIAFILFGIIVFFTVVTRLVTRNADHVPRRRRFGPTQPISRQDASRVASAGGME